MRTAQIERIHQSLDQCCRPVLNDLMAIIRARGCIIGQIVAKMEVSHPAVVEQMLSTARIFERKADGTLVSRRTGALQWTPAPPPELTRVMGRNSFVHPTEAACQIAYQDAFSYLAGVHCFELPTAMLDAIAKEPNQEIADLYRGYVRHSFMPLCRRVADQLREYSAYVELPSKEWLQKTFPGESWSTASNMFFLQMWYGYTASFERVLEEWSGGNFESVRPGEGLALGGLVRMLTWSQEQAEKKQAELIGMSTVVETDQLLFSYPGAKTSALSKEQGSTSYEVDTQGSGKGADALGEASFAMPLANDS